MGACIPPFYCLEQQKGAMDISCTLVVLRKTLDILYADEYRKWPGGSKTADYRPNYQIQCYLQQLPIGAVKMQLL